MKEKFIAKKETKINYSFYVLTDENIKDEKLFSIIDFCLSKFVTIIQLRIKNINSLAQFLTKAKMIKKITDKYKKPLIINDFVKIAKTINCTGVHIGQNDMEIKKARRILGYNKIIGVSVSTIEEAMYAEKNGANYICVGSIFNTTTKDDAKLVTIETLNKIKELINIPIIAIGGINEQNISKLYGSNIDGVAFVSEVMYANNLNNKLNSLNEKIKFLKH